MSKEGVNHYRVNHRLKQKRTTSRFKTRQKLVSFPSVLSGSCLASCVSQVLDLLGFSCHVFHDYHCTLSFLVTKEASWLTEVKTISFCSKVEKEKRNQASKRLSFRLIIPFWAKSTFVPNKKTLILRRHKKNPNTTYYSYSFQVPFFARNEWTWAIFTLNLHFMFFLFERIKSLTVSTMLFSRQCTLSEWIEHKSLSTDSLVQRDSFSWHRFERATPLFIYNVQHTSNRLKSRPMTAFRTN